jgi:DNA polymerase-3 subunit delta'
MGFEEIIGQDLIIRALRRSLSNGQTTHAYLFSGPDGSGKKSLALLFAQALNCSSELDPPCNSCLSCRKTLSGNHPDFYQLRPEGASIKIGQLRELKESLYYFPREGRKKVCLIHSADLMTLPAANSLLQILEEPPADLIFILLSSRPWALLPTIISRCLHFALKPLPPEEMELLLKRQSLLEPQEREIVIALAGGNPGKALELSSKGGLKKGLEETLSLLKSLKDEPLENIFIKAEELSGKENLQEIINLFLIIYRNRLLFELGGRSDIKLIKKKLQYNNINVEEKVFFPDGGNINYLEKMCRHLLDLQGELLNNINKRLAVEVLLLQMRGAV